MPPTLFFLCCITRLSVTLGLVVESKNMNVTCSQAAQSFQHNREKRGGASIHNLMSDGTNTDGIVEPDCRIVWVLINTKI